MKLDINVFPLLFITLLQILLRSIFQTTRLCLITSFRVTMHAHHSVTRMCVVSAWASWPSCKIQSRFRPHTWQSKHTALAGAFNHCSGLRAMMQLKIYICIHSNQLCILLNRITCTFILLNGVIGVFKSVMMEWMCKLRGTDWQRQLKFQLRFFNWWRRT